MIPGLNKRAFNFHDLLMYVALARKHLRLMCLLFVLSLMTLLTYFVFARPVYYSRAIVRVETVPLPLDTEKLYRDSRISMVISELNSATLRERTARSLGIPLGRKEIELRAIFKQRIRYTTDKTLEIETYPATTELARRWPEALIEQYLEFRQDRRIRDRDSIIRHYREELLAVVKKISTTRDDRYAQQTEADVTRVMINVGKLQSTPTDLITLGKRIDDVGRVWIKLQDPGMDVIAKLSLISSIDTKNSPVSVGQDIRLSSESEGSGTEPKKDASAASPEENATTGSSVIVLPSMVKGSDYWESLDKEREQIKSQIEIASLTYLPGNQKMRDFNKSLAELDQKLETELKVAENRLGLEYQELLNHRRELEAKLPEYDKIKKHAAKIKEEAAIFKASQLPWAQIYSHMRKRLEALDLANDKERVDLTFVSLSEFKRQPVSPQKGRLVLIALGLGLILAIGIPFLIEYLDHTLSNLEEIESTFRLRGLGIVPKLPDNLAPGMTLIKGAEKDESNLLENFRVIRTNVMAIGGASNPPQVLMITSAMPKEGKTVVSSNLSISFAQTGVKTLLMDTDLRRGRLHRLFGYRKSPGLSDVLVGDATLEESIRPTMHQNLSVLSAGKHIETGTELLGSVRFKEIMATLREKFERIVVDTPPILGLSDTSVLQGDIDGVIFVIWSGNTPIRSMKTAIDILQTNGANFYGFVLNRLDLNATTNYYQYYYYSQDYYYHTTHSLENA